MPGSERCDACEQPWAVKFEWDYTDSEQYCTAHMLEPIEGQPGVTLLDYMPDCQRISHRLTHTVIGDRRAKPGRVVTYRSVAELYPILTGRLWTPLAQRT
jgi:hypothetical protein